MAEVEYLILKDIEGVVGVDPKDADQEVGGFVRILRLRDDSKMDFPFRFECNMNPNDCSLKHSARCAAFNYNFPLGRPIWCGKVNGIVIAEESRNQLLTQD